MVGWSTGGDAGGGEVVAVLTIAGSDSGGGAGIQADLRTFFAHDVLGCTAVTALTAQNTLGVTRVEAASPGVVVAQIEAVMADLPVRAAKTGMLATAAIVEAVAATWARVGRGPLVVDPVMVSTSGAALLEADAVAAMRERLFPLAAVLTPNRAEAEALTGERDAARAAEALAELAPGAVIVVKGGDDDDPAWASDWVRAVDGGGRWLRAERVATRATHGTGCTFAAAIAAGLARGAGVGEAIDAAKRYLTGALRAARPVGGGHGPVDHLWALRRG